MNRDIHILLHLFRTEENLIKDAIKDLNIQQDVIYFNFINYNSLTIQNSYELKSLYNDVILKVKKELNLTNLITITDAIVYSETTNVSVGSYITNSLQIGSLTFHDQPLSVVKYELMRSALQLLLNKYLLHSCEGCFFDKETNLDNTKLCNYCHKQLSKLGLSERDISKFNKVLNAIKNEYMGIQDSNLFSVIAMDIVRYSKLMDLEQKKIIKKLQKVIMSTDMINRNLDNIVFLPTGDGCFVALDNQFYRFSVVLCTELQKKMKENNLQVRFGLNFGNVFKYRDINNNINIAGSGINMAARAMDVGDNNHIIACKTIYDILGNLDDWHSKVFHDVGKVTVKHGVVLDIYNIYCEEGSFGNIKLPQKVRLSNDS